MTGLRYMLDTNVISDLLRNATGKAFRKIREVGDDGLCVSIIVAAELRYGCLKRNSPKLTARVEELLSALTVAPFESPADREYADIRNALTRAGGLIGPNDMLIAAHARALRLPLATGNAAEFARVPRLALENWLA